MQSHPLDAAENCHEIHFISVYYTVRSTNIYFTFTEPFIFTAYHKE